MSINQQVPARKLHWNNFNLSHTYETTGRFGQLIPCDIMEVVPGDLFKTRVEFNMRLSPLSAPAMARLNVHFHSFYVPYRIITPRNGQYSTWERFVQNIGSALPDPSDPNYVHLPYFYTSSVVDLTDGSEYGSSGLRVNKAVDVGSLWDYLGLPPAGRFSENFNVPFARRVLALPHLAVLSCWNNWFRRDQIEPEIVMPLNLEGIDLDPVQNRTSYVEPEMPVGREDEQFDINTFVGELLKLRERNYERDYFTSGLPEPQYGDDVTISNDVDVYAATQGVRALGTVSLMDTMIQDVTHTSSYAFTYDGNTGYSHMIMATSDTDNPNLSVATDPRSPVAALGTYQGVLYPRPFAAGNVNSPSDQSPWMIVGNSAQLDIDEISGLTGSSAFTINQFRAAMQLQGVREQINRTGTRYTEIMYGVYGVKVSDLRLQRPQYLGGVKSPITIGAVLQTSESANTPQGTLTGQGGAVGGNTLYHTKHIFEEHGLIVTFMSVTPRTSYTGGVRRLFRKFDPIDYYCPAFDHLGEQQTMTSELYDRFDFTDMDGILPDSYADEGFAYNPMYQELKSAVSTSTGEFRNTLDNWVLTRSFNEPPTLSSDFIHADSRDFDRLFKFENVENTSNEHFQVQLYFDVAAKRPMSKYSTPFTFW